MRQQVRSLYRPHQIQKLKRMIILGIETSCDETALSLIETDGRKNPSIKILENVVLSQIDLHREYGGVFPMMAKREHAKNLIPLFKKLLEESSLVPRLKIKVESKRRKESKTLSTFNFQLSTILEREPELLKQFLEFIPTIEKPPIDKIAVTHGPGLEPTLWVGINFAKALGEIWDIPVEPINHMEGHIFASLVKSGEETPNSKHQIPNGEKIKMRDLEFPALALLISGGHTELILIRDWHQFEIIGETRDDAVGEAFDKVARIIGLPYPGGPEISRLAEAARQKNLVSEFSFPRPMLKSPDFDFSFSGLKTSVLYTVKKLPALEDKTKMSIALEFENAVTEVLLTKTKKAIKAHGIKTLLLGGGVVANIHIREAFQNLEQENAHIKIHIPKANLTTDNALMIALASAIRKAKGTPIVSEKQIEARGNLRLGKSPQHK